MKTGLGETGAFQNLLQGDAPAEFGMLPRQVAVAQAIDLVL
jgi:hypothetical protein